jgi:hypothetical protein
MVLDRDYRDDNSVAQMKKKLSNRVFFWSCHELENVLMMPSAILSVLHACSADQFKTAEEINLALCKTAENLSELFICQWAAYLLSDGGSFNSANSSIAAPRDNESFWKYAESQRTYATEAFSCSRVSASFEDAKKRVADCLASNGWMSILPGKEILHRFRSDYLAQMPHQLFINQVVSRLAEQSYYGGELERLVTFIKAQ